MDKMGHLGEFYPKPKLTVVVFGLDTGHAEMRKLGISSFYISFSRRSTWFRQGILWGVSVCLSCMI